MPNWSLLDEQRRDFDRGWDDVATMVKEADLDQLNEVKSWSFMPQAGERSLFADDRPGAGLPFRYLGRVEAIKSLGFRDMYDSFHKGPSPSWQRLVRRAGPDAARLEQSLAEVSGPQRERAEYLGLREAVLDRAMTSGDFGHQLDDEQRRKILDEPAEAQARRDAGPDPRRDPSAGPRGNDSLQRILKSVGRFASGDPSQTPVYGDRPSGGAAAEVSTRTPKGMQPYRGTEIT